MRLLVLAGGFGTRLRSAVPSLPKVLAPVSGVPFLHYQLDNWCRQGITSFVFLLHHQAELVVDFISRKDADSWCNADIRYVVESTPLGTGGSLVNAVRQLKLTGEFLVTNADTWLDSGIANVMQAEAPSMGIIKVGNAGRYGSVERTQSGTVSKFIEKDPSIHSGWINAGISHLNSDLFSQIPIEPRSLESDFYPVWARQGMLRAVEMSSNFIDIGIPEDYNRFCRWIESKKTEVL
jgi:D-glycero-alpha-D-manno-heptose 1-phosphate guanylyltransferase